MEGESRSVRTDEGLVGWVAGVPRIDDCDEPYKAFIYFRLGDYSVDEPVRAKLAGDAEVARSSMNATPWMSETTFEHPIPWSTQRTTYPTIDRTLLSSSVIRHSSLGR